LFLHDEWPTLRLAITVTQQVEARAREKGAHLINIDLIRLVTTHSMTRAMAFSETTQTTISPHNQKPLVTRDYPSQSELDATINQAAEAQKQWAALSLQERIRIGYRFIVSQY
jgi:acyl-CoA reductase-like NAD-dependent aldehyde dehydrogenase